MNKVQFVICTENLLLFNFLYSFNSNNEKYLPYISIYDKTKTIYKHCITYYVSRMLEK